MRTLSVIVAAAVLIASPAHAEDWPARPIHVVVGAGVGGGTDIVTRIITAPLADLLGQPVVVENKQGAGNIIAAAKAAPGKYNFSSVGVGTTQHFAGELFRQLAGIDIKHIPYRGGGPALTGLLGGEVHIFFSTLTQLLPYIRDGRLRGLAVTSETRSPLAPELPTMVESGFDDFVTASINFIVAPPGTPISIREQLSEAVAAALASTQVKDAFSRMGAKAEPASPKELSSYVAQQQLRWAKIVETTRISID